MWRSVILAACCAAAVGVFAATSAAQRAVEVREPVFALPADIVNRFEQPSTFVVTTTGDYLVLDRRAHTVVRLDADGRNRRAIVGIGQEAGHVLRPLDMALSDDDILAVLDAPGIYQRLQYFTPEGMRIGGFYLPMVGAPSVVAADMVVAGAGHLAFTGRTFWLNVPAWGSPMSELDTTGTVLRHVGSLRETGQEASGALHQALNTGLPVADPTGGMFFVFQNGRPMLRKYDAAGVLQFERHIEGPELDPIIARLPTRWATPDDGSRPLPAPVVRTAAADRQGRLWVALQTGHIYVYDPTGEKIRTIVFGGAAPALTSSLFFMPNGHVLTGPGGYEFDTAAPAAR